MRSERAVENAVAAAAGSKLPCGLAPYRDGTQGVPAALEQERGPMRIDGRVVLIAGAAGGLGHVVTPAFRRAGATVVTVGRAMPAEVGEGQPAFAADVTDEQDVRRVVTEVIGQTGRIDGLVNLVGAFAPGRVVETEVALWQSMLALNLTAAFLLSRAVVPSMARQGSGRIIHVAARAALEPFPGAAAYIVAKSGLLGLIRALALELAGTGVTINGVLPGTMDTPANRRSMPNADPATWVQPDTVAHLLLFLVSQTTADLNGALIPLGAR